MPNVTESTGFEIFCFTKSGRNVYFFSTQQGNCTAILATLGCVKDSSVGITYSSHANNLMELIEIRGPIIGEVNFQKTSPHLAIACDKNIGVILTVSSTKSVTD